MAHNFLCNGVFILKGKKEMSCTYEIGIMANKNVAEALDKFLESEDAKKNWSSYERKTLTDGSTMYRTWCNNYPSYYPIGKEFLKTIRKFVSSADIDDAFRCVMLSEEGSKEEILSALGDEIFEDFEVLREINYPEDFDTVEDVVQIEQTLRDSDADKNAKIMSDFLMDDQVKTYMMFEDLAAKYIGGSEEFRKGIDAALTTLLSYNMKEVAEKIAKENAA